MNYPDNGRLPPSASSVDYTYWKDGSGLIESGGCSGFNAVYRDAGGNMVSQSLTKPKSASFITQGAYRLLYDENYASAYGGF